MKSFNRFLLAGGLALGASVFGASSAMAQVTTGDVTIGGTVDSTLNVDITAVGGVDTTLDLGGEGTDNGETIVKVADITIRTNNDAGLSLTMTSGNMVATGSDTPLAYKVAVTGDEVAAATGDFTALTSGTDNVQNYAQAGGGGIELAADGTLAQDVSISYDPPQNLDAGDYTATITLTVQDL